MNLFMKSTSQNFALNLNKYRQLDSINGNPKYTCIRFPLQFGEQRFITRYLFRFHFNENIEKVESNCFPVLPQDVNQIVSDCSEPEFEPEIFDFVDTEYDGFSEKETPKFSFKFQFPSYEDTRRSNEESEEPVSPKNAFMTNTNTSKYQFLPGKDFSGFMEEPQVMNFTVKQLYFDFNEDDHENKEILHGGSLSGSNFLKPNLEIESAFEEIVEDSYNGEDFEKPESVILTEIELSGKDQLVDLESNSLSEKEISDGVEILSEKEEIIDFDSDSESISFADGFSYMNHIMDSNSEEFLSEKDFGDGIESETMIEPNEDIHNSEDTHTENPNTMDPELVEKFESPVENDLQNSSILGTEFLAEREFGENEAGECSGEGEDPINGSEKSQEPNFQNSSLSDAEEPNRLDTLWEHQDLMEFSRTRAMSGSESSQEPKLQNSSISDSEDRNQLETLWEHQDLIEQLKMELKKVRATGLPTILEESESPKVVDDLKPWKIDEKFLHEDRIGELHKFYKIYRERMRKFDILNYQKMYAIGFLQLKDPLQTISSKKSATPSLTSVLSHSFGLSKHKRPEAESTAKFIKELHNDLEVVYVGQLCLSWEFLHWQYLKARELLETDPYETRRYNEVAGEFQQFQVLIQRFLENELFQGPRVQNYIKNRCILRNLLQVPVVKEDSKDKDARRRKDAITYSMLLQIIEESIRIFWEFLRADKNEGNMILKGLLGPQVELHDPEDSELLLDVQTNLQKKEKKLKELLRIGNCIVRRFQKHHEERSDQVLFYSQLFLASPCQV
ncbi:Ribosomal protein L34Ae [Macleaya cordata]|uniref:Ribosomal protein L34Ae n=1 Tax=Macleaya cordata TaxID=56857 RepID=A0A200QSD4_MACCD|nr:Ribosomal protein L34Ae [Macleaya cordata]